MMMVAVGDDEDAPCHCISSQLSESRAPTSSFHTVLFKETIHEKPWSYRMYQERRGFRVENLYGRIVIQRSLRRASADSLA